jgi:hypothetical protein
MSKLSANKLSENELSAKGQLAQYIIICKLAGMSKIGLQRLMCYCRLATPEERVAYTVD